MDEEIKRIESLRDRLFGESQDNPESLYWQAAQIIEMLLEQCYDKVRDRKQREAWNQYQETVGEQDSSDT
jgi:hypothetical protein